MIRSIHYLKEFVRLEAASGMLLLGALMLVLIVANTPWYPLYQAALNAPISIHIVNFHLEHTIQEWVNEGLMAVFFMLLSLEIKREMLTGELSKPSQVVLPLSAGIGGIILPVVLFFAVLGHDTSLAARGWAIPTTTDIGLVLGVVTLLGRRVPVALRIMILALSIVDDIIAIALIAIVYAEQQTYWPLLLAGIGVAVLVMMNVFGVKRIAGYVLVGIFVWLAVSKSGVHSTLAGTIVGFCIPLRTKNEDGHSPLQHLEHILHPWVAYAIMPLFVLMNAGVRFIGDQHYFFTSKLGLAIFSGLFFGKQLGIFGFSWLTIKAKLAKLPEKTSWLQLYAAATLCGIGFTMSLFIAHLAFDGHALNLIAKQSVLAASFCSGILAIFIFLLCKKNESI